MDFRRLKFISSLLLFFGCLLNGIPVKAQWMTVEGTVMDTSEQKTLPHAVAMMVRLNDSLLTRFTRTDANGYFKMDLVPIDTYQVIISHPRFGDQTMILLGSADNDSFNLQKVTLPSKSITLNEVTVFGYADPVYYKGDTLVYTADSFKVKKNAVVEDLLKKLPGIRVDADGKIYSQGKAVDQVLVDGDEFFGSDPTVATKNLAASSVESVQVYDKKNEDASESDDKETLKIMDLKLKDNAKKGYFGKVSGAGDFRDFYEGELLANKFRGKQKISVFALATNTPRSRFDWDDVWKYGLNADMTTEYSEDGGMMTYWDGHDDLGIPRTLKSGFYYADKLNKNTKVSLNYTYSDATLDAGSETSSQYFLADTSYRTHEVSEVHKQAQSHAPNLLITQTLDSLTELEFSSKLKYNSGSEYSSEYQTYLTNQDSVTRTTLVNPDLSTKNSNWLGALKLTHNFKKKDRKLVVNYSLGLIDAKSHGILKSSDSSLPTTINQKKTADSEKQNHNATLTYTEPLSKRIKLELSYDMNFGKGEQDKKTFDFLNGDYSSENDTLTNRFGNERSIHRFGTKLSYEVKKYSVSAGTKIRQVYAKNENKVNGETLSQTVNNILPFFNYRRKFSDNRQLSLKYSTNSSQPDLNQLQPVPDNSNPNYIVKGNPDLLPTYSHRLSADFYSWGLLSGKHMWSSVGYNSTRHAIVNDVSYDSIGRTISRPVNAEGNYSAYGYFNFGFPILQKLIEFEPNFNFNYSNQVNFINGEKNNTKQFTPTAELDIQIETDTIEIHLGGAYNYHSSASSLNSKSDQSYYFTSYNASLEFTFPGKFRLETDAKYTRNYKREDAYNISTFIWNASLAKTLLKKENLIVSFNVTDLLNQNVNTSRDIRDNVISDVTTNLVGRYYLFKVMFKFNSDPANDEDED